jgi:hypothetical protein
VLVDEDQELEHDESGARRPTIWGAHPGRPSEDARKRRGDWVRASRQIWGRASTPPAGEPEPERVEPLLPIIEVLPAPVEDIIPRPEEAPLPSTEGLSWGEREAPYEPSRQDIWTTKGGEARRPASPVPSGASRSTEPAHASTGRFVLPDSWAAAPRRRPLLRRWLGDSG